jgi:hypothetical protein
MSRRDVDREAGSHEAGGCPQDGESIVAVADRHRQLTNDLIGLDGVFDVATVVNGPNAADSAPEFHTEIVIAPEFDAVPPTVLEHVAIHGLGLEPQPPQGDYVVVWAR